ncbi:MAG: hypothetical protein KAT88_12940, partial [Spirochaetes bacterium]|nr:hypothetical protein [Spirochaetota bacterium]
FGFKGQLEIVKKHPIKNSVFWMTLSVHPCHGREDDSQNGPGTKKSLKDPLSLGNLNHKPGNFCKDVIRC